MAMVGVVSGSLYRRTHSLSRLAWSWVGGRLAPFYIHQMNRLNSRNGSAMMTAPQTLLCLLLLLLLLLAHQQLEQSQTMREKRARFDYERAKKWFLSRFWVYSGGVLTYTQVGLIIKFLRFSTNGYGSNGLKHIEMSTNASARGIPTIQPGAVKTLCFYLLDSREWCLNYHSKINRKRQTVSRAEQRKMNALY